MICGPPQSTELLIFLIKKEKEKRKKWEQFTVNAKMASSSGKHAEQEDLEKPLASFKSPLWEHVGVPVPPALVRFWGGSDGCSGSHCSGKHV